MWAKTKGKVLFRFIPKLLLKWSDVMPAGRVRSLKTISNICASEYALCKQVTQIDCLNFRTPL